MEGEKKPRCLGRGFLLAYTTVTPLNPMELHWSKRGVRAASFLRVQMLTDSLTTESALYKQITDRTRGREEAEGENRLD